MMFVSHPLPTCSSRSGAIIYRGVENEIYVYILIHHLSISCRLWKAAVSRQ